MRMLSDKDHAFFRKHGYVVVRGVVPKENCDRVIDAIWACMGLNPENRDEWYMHPAGMDTYMKHQNNGILEMYHHQAMWDNRQHPNVHRAFAELWGTEKLWVSIDRVAMKPPLREGYEALDNSFIHWDLDASQLPPKEARPPFLQGMLMLADTLENQGGFQCVPSIYPIIDEYLAKYPSVQNHRVPANLEGHPTVKVTGSAGDLIIWDALLPHGNGRNTTDKPRYAQAITMNPAKPEVSREHHVACWRESWGHPGKNGEKFYGDPRRWEPNTYDKPAELTPLGRKLLGIDSWFDENDRRR